MVSQEQGIQETHCPLDQLHIESELFSTNHDKFMFGAKRFVPEETKKALGLTRMFASI